MKTKLFRKVALFALVVAFSLSVVGAITFKKDGVVANAASQTLFKKDFEDLTTSATEDVIYGASGMAGAHRTIVESGTYLKAPYTFGSDGWSNRNMYSNAGALLNSTSADDTYNLKTRFKPYGTWAYVYFSLQNTDTKAGTDFSSLVEILSDGRSGNYADGRFTNKTNIITAMNLVKGDDGWYDLDLDFNGTGTYIQFEIKMYLGTNNAETIANANANLTSGFMFESISIAKNGDASYYKADFISGLKGESEIYPHCLFGGFNSEACVESQGINGKTLRVKYDFWEDADGWRRGEYFYKNAGWGEVVMEEGSYYEVSYSVKLFGKLEMINAQLQQGDDPLEQLYLYPDMSFRLDRSTVKNVTDVNVEVVGDMFKVTARMKGANKAIFVAFDAKSNDPVAANSTVDTGIYFDDFEIRKVNDDATGEYEAKVVRDFENQNVGSLTKDDAFRNTGFVADTDAIDFSIEENINGKSLKSVYTFYDNGWQKDQVYFNKGYLGSTVKDRMYKYEMKIKPFGNVNCVYIGFDFKGSTEFLILKNGTIAKQDTSRMQNAYISAYTNGVYELTIYFKGDGNEIFNIFRMLSSDAGDANTNKNTGIIIDDYKISVKEGGFAVTERSYVADGSDLTAYYEIDNAELLTVDGTAVDSENYTLNGNLLTVKNSYMKTLSEGEHVFRLTDVDGVGETFVVIVDKQALGKAYQQDFSLMPELNGTDDDKTTFFRSSKFDPLDFNVYTEKEDSNTFMGFGLGRVSSEYFGLFQTNPNEGRLNMLNEKSRHLIAVDLKPVNGGDIMLRGYNHYKGATGFIDKQIFELTVNLASGKQTNGTQNGQIGYNVTALENGWYHLEFNFEFDGEENTENYAFVQFRATSPAADTMWYADNFIYYAELVPALGDVSAIYDVASSGHVLPYAVVDLCDGKFAISSVTVGETVLTEADYTLSPILDGRYRLDLLLSACENYSVGDTFEVKIATTKGNVLSFTATVTDSTPDVAESVNVDLADKDDLIVNCDLKGYEIAALAISGNSLTDKDFVYNENGKQLIIKFTYLETLTPGTYRIDILTRSYATANFTVTVTDTTPSFELSEVEYVKAADEALELTLDLHGKTLTQVKFGETVLSAEQYSYADGKLVLTAAFMNACNAGAYTLEVTADVSSAITVTVKDKAPEITGEYTVNKGESLEVTAKTYGRDIVSVSIDSVVLSATEYTFADGKLVINASAFEDFAAGEHTLTLVTSGGSASCKVTVKVNGDSSSVDPDNPYGPDYVEDGINCNSSLSGSGLAVLLGLASVAAIIRKKKND